MANFGGGIWKVGAMDLVNTSKWVRNPRIYPDIDGIPTVNIPKGKFHDNFDSSSTTTPEPRFGLLVKRH